MHDVSIQELKTILAVKDLPEDLLQWILDHSVYHEFEDGALIRKFGEPQDEMYFLLEGSVNFYMNVNGRQVYYLTFSNDTASGGVSGLLPYSRMKTSPGYAYAVGQLRTLMLHKDHFPELERRSPAFIQKLIGYMTERARLFATIQLQHEKVNALGKLAAGIAHELNNPAAAINGISAELNKRVEMNYNLTEKLLAHGIDSAQIRKINEMVEARKQDQSQTARLSTLQRLQVEDDIEDWLRDNRLENKREVAETLAEGGFSPADLDTIARNSTKEVLGQLVTWLENLLTSQRLIKDLEEASTRISNLVSAIKSHVHMDRTNELQPTDIHRDIDNTLTLLGYKIREKNITVNKTYCDGLAEVPAFVGELNQVWTNLIDNAIYALDRNGELSIETSCDRKNVKVKIIDNGSGIPKEIMSRIFDPFFTTKKVGEGTGIGLDLVNRIIKRHNGEIKVDSGPGRTEFAVCIPVAAPAVQPENN